MIRSISEVINYCKDTEREVSSFVELHSRLTVHLFDNNFFCQSEHLLRYGRTPFPPVSANRITACCVQRGANESRSAKGIYLALQGTRLLCLGPV